MYYLMPSRAMAMAAAADTIDKEIRAMRRERAERRAAARESAPITEPTPQPARTRSWWSPMKILRLAH